MNEWGRRDEPEGRDMEGAGGGGREVGVKGNERKENAGGV